MARKDDDACTKGTEESGDGAMQQHNQVQLNKQQDVGGSETPLTPLVMILIPWRCKLWKRH